VPELCREHGISSATFYKWRETCYRYSPHRDEENERIADLLPALAEDQVFSFRDDNSGGPAREPVCFDLLCSEGD
jgi:transposase-like protein